MEGSEITTTRRTLTCAQGRFCFSPLPYTSGRRGRSRTRVLTSSTKCLNRHCQLGNCTSSQKRKKKKTSDFPGSRMTSFTPCLFLVNPRKTKHQRQKRKTKRKHLPVPIAALSGVESMHERGGTPMGLRLQQR